LGDHRRRSHDGRQHHSTHASDLHFQILPLNIDWFGTDYITPPISPLG